MPYAEPEGLEARDRELLERLGHRNIFRMLAHAPPHLRNYCRLGFAIRHRGVLDPGLRELAITRTGILCQSPYEVAAHRRIAREAGVAPEKIEALERGAEDPVYDERERAVLRFTDDVVSNARPGEESLRGVRTFLGPRELVELQLAIGYYVMTSKLLNTFDIDLEPEPEPEPPD